MTLAGNLSKAFPAAYFVEVREFLLHAAVLEDTLVVLCSNLCKMVARKQRFGEEVRPGHNLSYHLIVFFAVLEDACVKVVETAEIEFVKVVGIEERAVAGSVVEIDAVAAIVQIEAALLHITHKMLYEYQIEACIGHLADAGTVLLGIGCVALTVAGERVDILPVLAVLGRIYSEDAGVHHIIREVVGSVATDCLATGDV